MMRAIVEYLIRVAALISQGINCVFLGGHHDQTVSARAYVQRHGRHWGRAYRTINAVFFWQKDHCKASFEADIEFARALVQRREHHHG